MRARLASILRWLPRFSSPPSRRPERPSHKLCLEPLEDRLTLSTTQTTGLALSAAALASAGYGPLVGDAYTFANGTRDATTDPSSYWAQPGGKGTPITVTYSYDNLLDGHLGGSLSASTIKTAIQQALALWASAAPINFVEVPDSGPPPSTTTDYSAAGKPMIRFGHLHVDGPLGVLGYGFYPGPTGLAGDIDFDDSENWTVNPATGIDLLEVATHEIGHALGLGHEPTRTAIMNPYYGGHFHGLGTGFLYQDDINGIQAIYGAGHGSVTPLASSPPSVVPSPFQVQGTQLTVTGTTGNDSFQFTAGASSATVILNGQSYSVNPALIHTIVFNGNGGTDSAILNAYGSSSASLSPTGATLTGPNYSVTLTKVQNVTVNGHAGDKANLYDSTGNDVFTASPASARLSGSGYQEVVSGFSSVIAHAGSGGSDTASLTAGTGINTFFATPTSASLYGTGYSLSLYGFANVGAHSRGGNDFAYLYGSAGNDTLVGQSTSTSLSGAGFANTAYSFRVVSAFSQGGRDTVLLYDAAGNNRFVGAGSTGTLYYPGATTTFSGFSVVDLLALSGGKDQKSATGITYSLAAFGPWA
jgi:hypothetical protein